jgi:hypothetical protein
MRYSRTTITIPTHIKERMERFKDKVNWSALASQAFEKKLDEIEDKIDCMNMISILDVNQ